MVIFFSGLFQKEFGIRGDDNARQKVAGYNDGVIVGPNQPILQIVHVQ